MSRRQSRQDELIFGPYWHVEALQEVESEGAPVLFLDNSLDIFSQNCRIASSICTLVQILVQLRPHFSHNRQLELYVMVELQT